MGLSLLTAPAVEPITWDLAKAHLRLSSDDEKAYVERVTIRSARRWAEGITARALITQTWTLTLSGFPCESFIKIPKPPLRAINSVKYLDTNGVQQTWAAENYSVEKPAGPKAPCGRVHLAYSKVWPSTLPVWNAVEIELECGYGETPASLAENGSVPEELTSAQLMILGELFERREDAIVGTISTPAKVGAERLALQYVAR